MKKGEFSKIKSDYLAHSLVGSALVFLLILYLSQQKSITRLLQERKMIKISSEQMQVLLAPYGGNAESALDAMNRQLLRVNARFPGNEMSVVSEISASARKLGLDVVSVTPGEKTAVGADEAGGLNFGGRTLQKVEVSFKAEGTYTELLKYFEYLYDTSSLVLTVNSFKINKGSGISDKLSLDASITVIFSI